MGNILICQGERCRLSDLPIESCYLVACRRILGSQRRNLATDLRQPVLGFVSRRSNRLQTGLFALQFG